MSIALSKLTDPAVSSFARTIVNAGMFGNDVLFGTAIRCVFTCPSCIRHSIIAVLFVTRLRNQVSLSTSRVTGTILLRTSDFGPSSFTRQISFNRWKLLRSFTATSIPVPRPPPYSPLQTFPPRALGLLQPSFALTQHIAFRRDGTASSST
ncbi:hypothetical protein EV421DRAFT_1982230 [Armillaria borealis]|uniref:Uncharacterized protein n=1 Tax=Armillaria borealis TaxID=47425 RepID=A0AA39J717_9AGAR|nr:hypothetical protein EV421DRAFT_1982230 [Armillaria borealis]